MKKIKSSPIKSLCYHADIRQSLLVTTRSENAMSTKFRVAVSVVLLGILGFQVYTVIMLNIMARQTLNIL